MIANEISHRRAAVCQKMSEAGVDWLALAPSADFTYLTGLLAKQATRLTLLLLSVDGSAHLVAPKVDSSTFDNGHLGDSAYELLTWPDSQDPYELISTIVPAQSALAVNGDLWARSVLNLQTKLEPREVSLSEKIVGPVRIVKSDYEVAELKKAAAAISLVHAAVPDILRPEMSEREVAAEITSRMIAAGHDQAEFVIVASGPRGAEPHHDPSDEQIGRNQLVVVDIGGPMASGYFSDMTRMYSIGEPSQRALDVTRSVKEAQELAVQAVKPGVKASHVDQVARQHLVEAGLGEWFIHRVGHGIGLEVHEPPWLGAKDDLTLTPGMTFSVEPGAYLPHQFGVRIEDIVLVTPDGVQRLNTARHELVIVE
jgi:Xaa-Pro aminopeptidase